MNITKKQRNNIIFLVIIALILIPQTRQPIQIVLHKGLALFSPSIEDESELKTITNYNWRLKDINGNAYNFNQSEGKVVLVNFWATWCPPCIAEMPSMQELYNDYSDKVDFVFVSDEKQDVLKSFLSKKNYSFNVYMPSEAPKIKLFEVRSIPRTFLLNKRGNIIIDKSGAANWNSDTVRDKIDALLLE